MNKTFQNNFSHLLLCYSKSVETPVTVIRHFGIWFSNLMITWSVKVRVICLYQIKYLNKTTYGKFFLGVWRSDLPAHFVCWCPDFPLNWLVSKYEDLPLLCYFL